MAWRAANEAELGELEPKNARPATPEELAELEPAAEERPWWLTKGAKPPEPKADWPNAGTHDEIKRDLAEAQKRLDDRGPTVSESVVRGAGRGASLGFIDEAAGLLNTLGTGGEYASRAFSPALSSEAQDEKTAELRRLGQKAEKEYREGRDEYRAADDRAQEANPKAFLAGQVAGSLVTAPAAPAGIAANVARGAAAGVASGVGESRADITRGEFAEVAKDAAVGGVIGGGVAGAGEVAKTAVKKTAQAVEGSIRRRLLNEVAEGTASVSSTGRKRLDKAGEAIVDEIIDGPDGDAVRKAYQGEAAAGREALEPVLEKVGAKSAAAYQAFEDAGRSAVDLPSYGRMLDAARKDAIKAGKSRLAAGIWAVQKHIWAQAEEAGGEMTLTQLRGLTTEAQEIASSVLGSLNEHANAKVARQVAGVVTGAMDDTLTEAAKGSKALEQAAKTIRENNRRFHALLTIDDALRMRAYKEGTGKGFFESAGKKVATTAAGGAALGALSSEDKLQGALEGAAAGAALQTLPRIGRAVDRSVTTAAIEGLRGNIPISLRAAENLARTGGRVGAGAAAAQVSQDRKLRGPSDDDLIEFLKFSRSGADEADVLNRAEELGIPPETAATIMRATSPQAAAP